MSVQMYDMGFGESILLDSLNCPYCVGPCEQKTECLLVDCGSGHPNRNRYFDNVSNEVRQYIRRSALISHFHDDHINGFWTLINNNVTFERVFIPQIFTTPHPNIIDYSLMRNILSRRRGRQATFSLWQMLQTLVSNNNRIYLLKRGDIFNAVQERFEVLWPVPELLCDQNLMNSIEKGLQLPEDIVFSIFDISDDISSLFSRLDNNLVIMREDYEKVIARINDSLASLLATVVELEINDRDIDKYIKKMRDCENKMSIVCHSDYSGQPVLLTGDVTRAVLSKILSNRYVPSMPVYEHYAVIKAPHHGTCTYFVDITKYNVSVDTIGISNGNPNTPCGPISDRYWNTICGVDFNTEIRCTNMDANRCRCFNTRLNACSQHHRCLYGGFHRNSSGIELL